MLFAGCRKVEPAGPEPTQTGAQGFTLTASYGEPDSKAAFGENGLDMLWTSGDVLYLVDPAGNNPTITLTTDITDPAKTAAFHTDESVTHGKYIVVYGQSSLAVQREPMVKSTGNLGSEVILYGGVELLPGQTHAEADLQQLFTMLNFSFSNIPADFTPKCVGMAVSREGLVSVGKGNITAEGLQTEFSGTFQTHFGWNSGDVHRVLIAPMDLTGRNIHFFLYGDGVSGTKSAHVTYEFIKPGRELNAGVCYNLKFDLASANERTALVKNEYGATVLASAADMRAAAFWASNHSFSLEPKEEGTPIDFTNQDYFPIAAGSLRGNGNIISNISCDLAECDYVGITSGEEVSSTVYELNVINANFTGRTRVGTLAGHGMAENCVCSGVYVYGTEKVGGMLGSCIAATNLTLTGQGRVTNLSGSYTGGICGFCSDEVHNCMVGNEVTVYGMDYLGGIAGSVHSAVVECGCEGNVQGDEYVGGITGSGYCERCYVKGIVDGSAYVGGVSGTSGCSDCYFIGMFGSNDGAGGGISGATNPVKIVNCYSFCDKGYEADYGLCYEIDEEFAFNNLTSCSLLSDQCRPEELCNCGSGKTFLSLIDKINGNDAYVTTCWSGLEAACPLLKWQYEGFDSVFSIPGFTEQGW